MISLVFSPCYNVLIIWGANLKLLEPFVVHSRGGLRFTRKVLQIPVGHVPKTHAQYFIPHYDITSIKCPRRVLGTIGQNLIVSKSNRLKGLTLTIRCIFPQPNFLVLICFYIMITWFFRLDLSYNRGD